MAKIIRKTPNANGAFPPIQSWADVENIPEGFVLVGDTLNTDVFYQHNGFITLVFDDENILVGFSPNLAAWEAWKAAQPVEEEPETELTAEDVAAAILEGVNNI